MPMQNQTVTTIPNVLSDQTVPNTLGGVGQPGLVARDAGWSGWPMLAGAIVLAVAVATVLAVGVLLD